MDAPRRYNAGNAAIGAAAIGHALLTWPPEATLALFVGGAAVAFVAETVVVAAGMLDHAMAPRVLGVPLSVVIVWPAITYGCLRVALLVVPPGLAAAALAAVIGTVFDQLTEPFGLAEGVWRYPDHPLSTTRIAGMPWWNVAGWLVLVFVTASLPILVAF